MEQSHAEAFATEWIEAWNAHDLVRILSHYADDIIFRSPRIALVLNEPRTFVSGKDALRDYWRRALERSPSLHFTLDRIYFGSDSLTIAYRNHRGEQAAETFVFRSDGLVVESIATYCRA
jgi:hypothetical protein